MTSDPTNYIIDLNPRLFAAIKAGTKKAEGRVKATWDKTPYDKMNSGDTTLFNNNESGEMLMTRVKFIHHYPSVRCMLESEGVENVLSSKPKTIEQGIESYHQLEGYEKAIKTSGIYAIGVELV